MDNTNQFKWTDELVKEYVNSLISPLQQLGGGSSYVMKGYTPLEDFKKSKIAKEPLFTTNDGKKIFEGDTYWTMDKNSFHYWYSGAASKIFESGKSSSVLLYFSTEDAAKEYILMNKPLLTCKDITDAILVLSAKFEIKIDKYSYNGAIVEKVVELAQTKINGN